MPDPITVTRLGKKFRRYHSNRPSTLKEAVLSGLRGMEAPETFWALRDVSFSVPRGVMLGVVGRNGSGKSTLLRLAGGVGRADEGNVHVIGRIGSLLELGAGFNGDLTGRENAYISGVIAGLSRGEMAERFDAIVDFAGLSDSIDMPLRTYSTGMQMRLGFSVAVHTSPEVLLIDEFLSVGDARFQKKCLERIDKFREEGCAIMLVSHDLEQVRRLCDRVLWLRGEEPPMLGEVDTIASAYETDWATGTERRTPKELISQHPPAHTSLKINENRFGSFEAEIISFKLLDDNGREIVEMKSGGRICLALKFHAKQVISDPIFGITMTNPSGVKCCEMSVNARMMGVSIIDGEGELELVIERLDLAGGSYQISVWLFEEQWNYAYDHHHNVYPLEVRSSTKGDWILNPPHSWRLVR